MEQLHGWAVLEEMLVEKFFTTQQASNSLLGGQMITATLLLISFWMIQRMVLLKGVVVNYLEETIWDTQ